VSTAKELRATAAQLLALADRIEATERSCTVA